MRNHDHLRWSAVCGAVLQDDVGAACHRQPRRHAEGAGRRTGVLVAVGALFAMLGPWPPTPEVRSAEPEAVTALTERAVRAGLRVLTGERLVLATDRPARDGDGIAELPGIFDQAFDAWCRHYRLDPERLGAWRAFGCLIVDRERFRDAGLLPDDVPAFVNGFCDRHRLWLADQSNPAYRRHLLLHEGVHAFTITVRDLAAPAWYMEGIAEHLATHRLEYDDGAPRFIPTPVPDRPGDAEQFGRIEALRSLRAAGSSPALADVFAQSHGDHRALAAYAASWAAVTLLALHPAHAAPFAMLEQGPLGPDMNARLAALPGWDAARASRDFDAFTEEVDYGYDVPRMAIDWSPGRPLTGRQEIDVDASTGWRNTGLALEAGRTYTMETSGRYRIGTLADTPPGRTTVLESEADGISLRWYRGRMVGRLLIAQWNDAPAAGRRPGFDVLAEGAATEVQAIVDGPLYVRINEAPRALADNVGGISLRIAPR